jgi:hypothetical protein
MHARRPRDGLRSPSATAVGGSRKPPLSGVATGGLVTIPGGVAFTGARWSTAKMAARRAYSQVSDGAAADVPGPDRCPEIVRYT